MSATAMNMTTALSLPETLGTLWRRKGLLLLGALTGAVLAFALSIVLPPQYQAEGSLVVRSQAMTAQDNDAAFNAAAVNEAVVTTEQDVLMSRGLLARVAKRVNIPPDMLEQWNLTGMLVSAGQTLASLGGPGAERWFDHQMETISPPPSDPAADKMEKRIQFLTSAIKVTTTKGSSVLKLRATTRDAQLSADIVNEVQELYTADRLAEQTGVATLIEQALRGREENTKQQISEAEDRLTGVMGQPGAIESSEVPGLMRDMSQLGAKYAEAQVELARRQSDYNSAIERRTALAGDPIAFADALGGGRLPLLRQQYDNAQQDLARLPTMDPRADVTRTSIQRQLNRLVSQINAEANRIVEQRRSSMLAAQQVVARLDKEMDATRQKHQSQAGTTIAVERERGAVASLWRTSDAIESRLIDLAARPANPNSRILTHADAPPRPAFPSKVLFSLAGFVMGTVAAGGYTLMTARSQGLRLGAPQIAERLKAPFLGGVPRLRGSIGGSKGMISYSGSRASPAVTVTGVVLELEKAIRAGEIRSLLVTSARSGEGKTTISVGIGKALSALGLDVLLVDLDLHRPRAEAALGAVARASLQTETIQAGSDEPLTVKVDRSTSVSVFTPVQGRADPMATLRSDSLSAAMTVAKGAYDIVLIDTPPVLSVPDALVAAKFADAILVVTASGGTENREVDELSRRLSQTGRPIHGVIATKVEPDDPSAGVYMGY